MAKLDQNLDFDFSVFSKNLKALIDSRGMSMLSLADDINITSATLSRYISGMRRPSVEYIVMIARYFDVSVDWLLGIQKDRYADVIDEKMAKVLNLYTRSSPEDQRVIDLILTKYED